MGILFSRSRPEWGGGLSRLFSMIQLTAFVVAAPTVARGDQSTKYDFSHPEKVFATSLAETFASLGVSVQTLEQLLQAGELTLINTHPATKDVPWLSTDAVLVDAPLNQVYAAMSDVEHYPEFLPQVTSSRRAPVVNNIDQVFLELGIHVLLTEIKNQYSLYYYYQPPRRIDWILAEGEFEANIGSFELVPVPENSNRTILFHTSYALPRNKLLSALFSRVPDLDLMVNLTTGTMMMHAMKNHAEKLFVQGGGVIKPAPVPADIPAWLHSHAQTLAGLTGHGEVFMLERSSPTVYAGVARLSWPLEDVYYATTHMNELAANNPYLTANYLERSERKAKIKVESTISLMIDFDAEYIMDVTQKPPDRSSWTAESDGDLAGVVGSWELVSLGPKDALAIYRNTSDLNSLGFTMRKLLELEPNFAHSIHIAETRRMIGSLKAWRPLDNKR